MHKDIFARAVVLHKVAIYTHNLVISDQFFNRVFIMVKSGTLKYIWLYFFAYKQWFQVLAGIIINRYTMLVVEIKQTIEHHFQCTCD